MPDVFLFTPGWIDDGKHHAIARQMGAQSFRDVAPGLMLTFEPPSPVMIYRAWVDVIGKYPDYPAQQIGDCCGVGFGHANDLLQCVEMVLGEPSEYQETDTEFIYAEGRKVTGGLERGDGSYGAAMVKAAITVGLVSRPMLGSDGVYSGQRAKQWGRHGPPANVEAMAAPFKLGACCLIGDRPTAVSALWNGNPITIASNQGFTLVRDQDGTCEAKGVWGHQMVIAGYDPGENRAKKARYLILQSWGPNMPDGPLWLDQPSFSFWADAKVIEENIFSQGDSWALFKAPDFKQRTLPSSWAA